MLPLLRITLGLVGTFVVWLGLDVGLGGIMTLGWQDPTPAIHVTDPDRFAVRNSHIRFVGGVWTALGLGLIAGALAPRRMRPVLLALIGMVWIGGAIRAIGAPLPLLTSADIAPSLIAELVLFPLLGLWIATATRKGPHMRPQSLA